MVDITALFYPSCAKNSSCRIDFQPTEKLAPAKDPHLSFSCLLGNSILEVYGALAKLGLSIEPKPNKPCRLYGVHFQARQPEFIWQGYDLDLIVKKSQSFCLTLLMMCLLFARGLSSLSLGSFNL